MRSLLRPMVPTVPFFFLKKKMDRFEKYNKGAEYVSRRPFLLINCRRRDYNYERVLQYRTRRWLGNAIMLEAVIVEMPKAFVTPL